MTKIQHFYVKILRNLGDIPQHNNGNILQAHTQPSVKHRKYIHNISLKLGILLNIVLDYKTRDKKGKAKHQCQYL